MLCWLFCHGCVVQSLPTFLSAIEDFCRRHSLPVLPRGPGFKRALKGLRNIFEQVDIEAPAVGLTERNLLVLRECLDFSDLQEVRFWCQVLLGFQGLLRADEFLRLRAGDLRFMPWGIQVVIPFSKTNLTPTPVGLVTRGDLLCPVAAFATLFELMKGTEASTPLFPHSYSKFNSELQRRCKQAGLPAEGISTHSLRRGGCTALFYAGVPAEAIMAHGRWSSAAWRKYIDFDVRLQQLPTRLLLLHPCGYNL